MPLKKVPVLKLILVIRNKSVQELANFVGNERSQVSTWVNGRDEPNREQAQKIADYLKWDLDEIWEDEPTIVKAKRTPKEKVGRARLVDEGALKVSEPASPALYALAEANGLRPVLSLMEADGMHDQAGIPIWDESVAATSWASNDPTGDVSFAWVPADLWKHHGAELRAITVAGRSMEKAGIDPGDVLLVRQTSDPRRAQNEIVIAACADGMTVKRLRGRALVAESNLDISPIPVGRDAKLKGVVVGIHKKPKQ